jgi:hypothetical protein
VVLSSFCRRQTRSFQAGISTHGLVCAPRPRPLITALTSEPEPNPRQEHVIYTLPIAVGQGRIGRYFAGRKLPCRSRDCSGKLSRSRRAILNQAGLTTRPDKRGTVSLRPHICAPPLVLISFQKVRFVDSASQPTPQLFRRPTSANANPLPP